MEKSCYSQCMEKGRSWTSQDINGQKRARETNKKLLSTFFSRGGIFEAGCEHFKSKIRQLEKRHRQPVRAKDRRNRGLRLNLFSHGPQYKLISLGARKIHSLSRKLTVNELIILPWKCSLLKEPKNAVKEAIMGCNCLLVGHTHSCWLYTNAL